MKRSPAISLVLLYWLLRRKRTCLAVSWLQVTRGTSSPRTHAFRARVRACGRFDISRRVGSRPFFSSPPPGPSLLADFVSLYPGPATASGHARTSPYLCGFRMAVPENFGERNRVFLDTDYPGISIPLSVGARSSPLGRVSADCRLILKCSFIRVVLVCLKGWLDRVGINEVLN